MLKNTPPLLFASRLKRHISFRMKGLCRHKEMTFYHLCKSLSVFCTSMELVTGGQLLLLLIN